MGFNAGRLARPRPHANVGAPWPGYTRITSTHASPVAHPRGASGVPRAASDEYGVLIGRESAQIAESAEKPEER